MDSAHFEGYVYAKIFYSANLCNGIVFLETFSDVCPRPISNLMVIHVGIAGWLIEICINLQVPIGNPRLLQKAIAEVTIR